MRAAAVLLMAAVVAASYGAGAVAVFCLVATVVTFLVQDWPMASAPSIRPSAPEVGERTNSTSRELLGVDALGDPALIVGGDLRVIAANAGARRLFGERVVADDLRLVLRHPAVLDAVRAAASAAAPVEREVTGLGTDNGAYRIRAAPLGADGPGERERLLITFLDITQTRLTERMRVDFIANASHELRTPVTTLLGFIETLQGPAAEDEPARLRFLEIMHREAGRMSRLIDDLLSLSRIELDKHVRPQTRARRGPADRRCRPDAGNAA